MSFALVLTLTGVVNAQAKLPNEKPPNDKPPNEQALSDFERGSQLLRDGKASDALPLLQASMSALPSPNTELLIAHATRELGDRALALDAYEKTVELASIRVRAGENRFVPTLDDAEHWASELRAGLAKLVIVVDHADETARLRVDGKAIDAHRDSSQSTLSAHLWHEPGAVRIEAIDGASNRAVASSNLAKGLEDRVTLDLAPSKIRPPPAASWVTAGVGVAGIVTFGVFEGMARSKASTLEACSPHCDPTDQRLTAARDDGKRDQTVAGVSLGIGIASLAAAGIMWALWPRSHGKPEATASLRLSRDVRLGVSGRGLNLSY